MARVGPQRHNSKDRCTMTSRTSQSKKSGYFLGLLYPEDFGNKINRTVCNHLQADTGKILQELVALSYFNMPAT